MSGLIIDVLVTDAFGGFGGISEYNRRLISAVAEMPEVSLVRVTPRVVATSDVAIPDKVHFDTLAAQGKQRFLWRRVLSALLPRPDLIICGHINLLPFSMTAATCLGVPHVLQLHGIEAWHATNRWLTNFLARRVVNVFSVSQTTWERFQTWTGNSRNVRHWIIPNTFDHCLFSPGQKPDALIARYGLKDRWVILTLGRLVSEQRAKGFDTVLEALPAILKAIPNAIYLIAGDGPDSSRLYEKAERLGVLSAVKFLGRVSQSEMQDHYLLADLFAMPSRGEGFGIVLLEALACGVPVIGSTLDGTRDALLNGQLGQLVNPDCVAELVTAICNVHAWNQPQSVPNALSTYSYENFTRHVRAAVLAASHSAK